MRNNQTLYTDIQLSKVLESSVALWMLEAIEGKFNERQFGGLHGRSTTHALIDILHTWHQTQSIHFETRYRLCKSI